MGKVGGASLVLIAEAVARMRRTIPQAVVVVVAALACSGCGTARTTPRVPTTTPPPRTTTSAPRTITVSVPVTQQVARFSGAGSKTLRAVALHGPFSLRLSCTGKGHIRLEIDASPSIPGLETTCPTSGSGIGPEDGSDHADHRARVSVDAPSRVHWTIAVRETYPKPSIVPAGLQQLPLRRSGVGAEALGTFALTHGWLYIVATCVGKGKFGVWFNRPELGVSAACLNSRQKATLRDVSSGVTEHRARIDVDAPVGMKWTVVVFAGPSPSRRPHDLTNVWR